MIWEGLPNPPRERSEGFIPPGAKSKRRSSPNSGQVSWLVDHFTRRAFPSWRTVAWFRLSSPHTVAGQRGILTLFPILPPSFSGLRRAPGAILPLFLPHEHSACQRNCRSHGACRGDYSPRSSRALSIRAHKSSRPSLARVEQRVKCASSRPVASRIERICRGLWEERILSALVSTGMVGI